jgi:hypothetical protein
MQHQARRIENILNSKNIQICEARMQADVSRADVIRLCGVIEAKDAEIQELKSKWLRRGPVAVKSA